MFGSVSQDTQNANNNKTANDKNLKNDKDVQAKNINEVAKNIDDINLGEKSSAEFELGNDFDIHTDEISDLLTFAYDNKIAKIENIDSKSDNSELMKDDAFEDDVDLSCTEPALKPTL